MNDYIISLKKYIKTANVNQARDQLKHLSAMPLALKIEVLETLALAPDKIALTLLDFIVSRKNNDPDMTDRLIQLVTDRAHLNFQFAFVLYRCADREKIREASPLLRHILTNETQVDILTATIETIGREKIESLIDDVAEFMYYDDRVLKAKAIRALERIGTAAAFERLEQAAGTEKCDQDILNAVEYLKINRECRAENCPETPTGQTNTTALIRELISQDPEKRFKAVIMLSEMGGDQSFSVLWPLLKLKDHDLVILCLKIFSRTLPQKIVSHLFSILDDKTADHGIKFAVYQLLGNFPELDSAAALVKEAFDPVMVLRMAAVRALDKNMTDFVAAEIKKKIESGTKSATLLAETILEAEAKNLIYFLLGSDTFSYMASNYFLKPTTGSVIETYISALEQRKLKATVRKYRDIAREQNDRNTPRVIVVSSSDIILKVYAKLITSSGFRPVTFHTPQDAFEAILDQKPDLLITDLFLNDMTGIEFAVEIRDIYSIEDLPVVVSSLQKELIEILSGQKKTYAAVNAFYEFPVKSGQIKFWVRN